MQGGPHLALIARLTEAVRWDEAVRRHEEDPWSYLRRKLLETEPPLRELKVQLLQEATDRLLKDLARPDMTTAALPPHREAFEPLLSSGDFADLSCNLDPTLDPELRVRGAQSVLAEVKVPTLFDLEALPPQRRSEVWAKSVWAMARRLQLDALNRIADEKGLESERRRRYLVRRLRNNLAEFLSVARGAGGAVIRDEITPFMLSRLEASIAACLRFLNRWR